MGCHGKVVASTMMIPQEMTQLVFQDCSDLSRAPQFELARVDVQIPAGVDRLVPSPSAA